MNTDNNRYSRPCLAENSILYLSVRKVLGIKIKHIFFLSHHGAFGAHYRCSLESDSFQSWAFPCITPPQLFCPVSYSHTVLCLQEVRRCTPSPTLTLLPCTHRAALPHATQPHGSRGLGCMQGKSPSLDSERVDLGRIWCLTLANEYLARCNHLSHGFNSIQQTFIEHPSASRFLSVL